MSKGLQLHQPGAEATLNRSFFRPIFEEPKLEAAWMVERLETFKRVNKRALWVLVLVSLVFAFMDVAYVDSELPVFLTRIAFVVFLSLLLVVVNKVSTVRWGDPLIAVACITGLAATWFHIFLKLPANLVQDWWLVTLALFGIVLLVLVEMMLLARLTVAGVLLVFGVGAPLKLGMDWNEALYGIGHVLIIFLVGWVAAWQVEVSRRLAFARRMEVEEERGRTVSLLRNILPESIADRLLNSPETIAERHQSVTVLFADIVGFTPWAADCEADEVVEVLDQIFSAFDSLCDQHGVEKIK
ncbi:MAG: adenylate/guanylate cyclase domain-containing protein, partial [Myxococcota bacterium]|nr:adenylate/guanylate cyclase domain-containing protein [Myxococcota bacterium]